MLKFVDYSNITIVVIHDVVCRSLSLFLLKLPILEVNCCYFAVRDMGETFWTELSTSMFQC